MSEQEATETTTVVDVNLQDTAMDGAKDMTVEVGNGGVTFEDLDDMEESREEFIDAKAEEQGKRKQKDGEEGQEKSGDGKEDKEKGEAEDKKDGKDEDKEDDDKDKGKEGEEDGKPKDPKSKGKVLKGKNGEDDIEIGSETTFSVPVGGEEEAVTVQELINNYSGNKFHQNKLTELDRERRTYLEDKEDVMSKINAFKEKAGSEDKQGAIKLLLDFAKVDSYNFFKEFREQMLPEVEKLADMTEDERDNYELQLENTHLKNREESKKSQTADTQKQTEIRERLDQLREAQKLSEDEVVDAYGLLVEKKHEGITPDVIVETASQMRAGRKSSNILEKVNPELVNDDKVWNELADIIVANPEFTDEDLTEIVQDTYGTKKDVQAVTDKLKEAGEVKKDPILLEETGDFQSFDDFEEGY